MKRLEKGLQDDWGASSKYARRVLFYMVDRRFENRDLLGMVHYISPVTILYILYNTFRGIFY